ncbi:AAA family ATPase [Planococcus donghaensis]|nr:AAA family ATPase [Planococcus donghaensis]
MRRFVIMTVGKTHSGKTIFAKALEKRMPNSVAIDQDVQAEILSIFYPNLIPKEGTNTIKYALTQTIVDYTVEQTNCHIILSNSNRSYKAREKLLNYFKENNFICILVNFEVHDRILEERIKESHRDKTILRTMSFFEEVLIQQQKDAFLEKKNAPTEKEADYLFRIKSSGDFNIVISKITELLINT